jgi:hypothetical protein
MGKDTKNDNTGTTVVAPSPTYTGAKVSQTGDTVEIKIKDGPCATERSEVVRHGAVQHADKEVTYVQVALGGKQSGIFGLDTNQRLAERFLGAQKEATAKGLYHGANDANYKDGMEALKALGRPEDKALIAAVEALDKKVPVNGLYSARLANLKPAGDEKGCAAPDNAATDLINWLAAKSPGQSYVAGAPVPGLFGVSNDPAANLSAEVATPPAPLNVVGGTATTTRLIVPMPLVAGSNMPPGEHLSSQISAFVRERSFESGHPLTPGQQPRVTGSYASSFNGLSGGQGISTNVDLSSVFTRVANAFVSLFTTAAPALQDDKGAKPMETFERGRKP